MKKLTYIILAICVMLAAGCPSDSEMTDSISEAEAAVESHNTYTVTFDPNGGDGRTFSQSFRGGRMQPLMRCSFKRTGWTFSGGWAVEPDGEKVYRNNEQVILTKDLTLYAVWTAHKYTIKFDANGGAGDMEDLSMTYDVTKHLSPNEFTRAGYGFTGWNTASDGSGTSYANGAGISNLTATDNDVVTLYAQWAAGWVDYT
ncbi:MAG: InlB B-repeat-containing protein, partial [Spirochaetales bacterium]|nr:InlB B-repeat-containing protein [Spirochaetales bacterium]